MEMLFIRDFAGFTGGHLKVLHYLEHTARSTIAVPVLYQTPQSRKMFGNIFNQFGGRMVEHLRPFPCYFLAGEDWFMLDKAGIDPSSAYVINLIQGFRHADPRHPLFHCLRRPALRICVSPAVAQAIRDNANGDVFVIENGVDLQRSDFRPLNHRRVLVAGYKNASVAEEVAANLRAVANVDLVTEFLPRERFLRKIAEASVCVMLPLPLEGFFLPPLEAMAIGRGVVTPNCGGNLSFCRHGDNCLMPEYSAGPIADAVRSLLEVPLLLSRLVSAGLATAADKSMDAEYAAYRTILARYLQGP